MLSCGTPGVEARPHAVVMDQGQDNEAVDKELWATVEDLHAQNKALQEQLAATKQQLMRASSSGCAGV